MRGVSVRRLALLEPTKARRAATAMPEKRVPDIAEARCAWKKHSFVWFSRRNYLRTRGELASVSLAPARKSASQQRVWVPATRARAPTRRRTSRTAHRFGSSFVPIFVPVASVRSEGRGGSAMGASRAVLLPRIKPRRRFFGGGSENEDPTGCATPHPDKKTRSRADDPLTRAQSDSCGNAEPSEPVDPGGGDACGPERSGRHDRTASSVAPILRETTPRTTRRLDGDGEGASRCRHLVGAACRRRGNTPERRTLRAD